MAPRTHTRQASRFASHPLGVGLALLAPSLVVLLAIRVYPLFSGIWLALTNRSLLRPNSTRFVGLENIIKIVAGDPDFYKALSFSLVYTLAVVALAFVVGLALAILLNQDVPLRGLFRVLILIPWVVPTAVATSNWLQLMNDQFGLINHFLLATHLVRKPVLFVADPRVARITVIVFSTWKALPFMSITLLAGLQSIPRELYESARIDGAGALRSFAAITIPLLRNVTNIGVTLMSIWTFNNFEDIYLLTGGGPIDATQILPILSYNTAFFRGYMGYAAAISTVMALLLFVLTLPFVRQERNIYS
jgi:ABC-type sugar transport system permease subunit